MSYRNLQDFFRDNPKAAIAFSGGVDSAYLLAEAVRNGAEVKAYFVKSQFQPEFELEDAKRLAEELSVELEVVGIDILVDENICRNPSDRCYLCKNLIFRNLITSAKRDGFDIILDGTNASDQDSDRPGMKALREMKVISPLRLCSLKKEDVRRLSKEIGLFTWDKPSYACLATRIPQGTYIRAEILAKIEAAELEMTDMGFSDFRVRYIDGFARIQVKNDQIEEVIAKRTEIKSRLKPYFDTVLVDLEER